MVEGILNFSGGATYAQIDRSHLVTLALYYSALLTQHFNNSTKLRSSYCEPGM